ncbi:PUS7L: Pseudouridylate synthase 7 like [Crotalus adamanteus]|uniref:PUS7L: Pseudouridylate synthase 7 like n=1 Tax=Crotalus adamanteus TaxID=8729 RepID=A0AAW1BCW7_CROAD
MEKSSEAPEIVQFSTYINDHTGFSGNIKTFPSDFVVTEINILGQLVNEIVADSFPKPSGILSEERTSGPQDSQKLWIDKECSTKESCRIQVDNVYCSTDQLSLCVQESEICKDNHIFECHCDKAVILDILLDEWVREQLHQFACHFKNTWNSAYESRDVLPEFTLGSVLDKKVRASLHGAIRQEYPFIITATKCDGIIIKANQDYQELCQLVSEEAASGFLKFLDAKLENSKFAFRPDGNKEHRKILCRFLNKKIGKLIESKLFPDSQQKLVIVIRFHEKSRFGKRTNSNIGEKHNIYTDT